MRVPGTARNARGTPRRPSVGRASTGNAALNPAGPLPSPARGATQLSAADGEAEPQASTAPAAIATMTKPVHHRANRINNSNDKPTRYLFADWSRTHARSDEAFVRLSAAEYHRPDYGAPGGGRG